MRRFAVVVAFAPLAFGCGVAGKCADGATCSTGHEGGGAGLAGSIATGGGDSAGNTSGGTASGGDATSGHASGGGATSAGTSSGGASGGSSNGGHSDGGNATAGKGGSTPECPPECLIAITCLTKCGGTTVSVGCCPCVAPAVDAKTCK